MLTPRPLLIALVAVAVSFVGWTATAQDVDQAEIDANLEGLSVLRSFAEFGEPLYPDDFQHFDYVNPDAPKGGSVRLSAFGTYERLDTITLGGRWPGSIGLVYDSLFTGSGDELSSYYPLIAESVAVPDDLSYAIFTINPEARYHDGAPIVAGDFVFAFNVIKEDARPLLREFYNDIVAAEALNERQVRFDFATTDDYGTLGLAAGFSPWPEHWWEASGRDTSESYLEPILYHGPYTIDSLDPGRSISYRRVEDYWAADLPVNRGQNNFDQISYIYFRDINVMFEAFLGGEFDFWAENEARRWATGYDVSVVTNGDIIRDESIEVNTPRGYIGFVFNTRRPVFSDIRVREAITQLWDFEWTRANVFYGQYRRARSFFPNSDFGVEDFPMPTDLELEILEPYGEQIPAAIFTEPFELPETDGSGRIRQQLRDALALFAEAGWEVDNGTLRNVETGEPFRFQILLRSDTLLRVVEPFIANLRRAGIDAQIRTVDTAQYERLTDDFDYDMIYIAANFFPPPGGELRTYFEAAAAEEVGSGNWPGVADPVVDELLERVMSDRDDIESLEAVTRALDRILLRGYYIIPSYLPDVNRIAFWNIFGQPETHPVYGIGFPGTWWYDEEVAASLQRQRRR